ncbi:cation:proton antiporter [Serratia marcescens]|uniref:cation:proton antiporter n=1 Tax=Serratia marcescens TaxID=615 RepID=UPI0013DC8829|nr:cation:proton antiporter [Serratia marcescens]
MTFTGWIALTGLLLLGMSLASNLLKRGPFTTFGFYLLIGILCGPWIFDIIRIDIIAHASWMERITSVAMAASLFITGLKLRQPFSNQAWRVGFLLALPAMLLTVCTMAAVAHYLIGFAWPLALAFGAIVAPTDPVLASLISVSNARDDDALRSSLSIEAGLNDAAALPFLLLALLLYHSTPEAVAVTLFARWGLIDLLWALSAGLLIGYLLGWFIGLLAMRMRHRHQDIAPNDLIALALIALSYSLADSVAASGFLAAFAAGVGLRRAEKNIVAYHLPGAKQREGTPPAEELVNPNSRHSLERNNPAKSIGLVVGDAITFGDTLERLFAAAIVITLGITLSQHWDPRGIVLGLILFILVRPIIVYIATLGSPMPGLQRALIGWLGIRGIGSINYIAYAYAHGIKDPTAADMFNMALTLVVTSVLLHGLTLAPLLRLRKAKKKVPQPESRRR